MTAPDRIALRWELGAAVTSGPLMDHPDYTQYVRADLVDPAAIREAALTPALTANPVDASQTPDPVVNAIMAGYDRKPAPDANNGG